jgi:hypothetical protein
LLQVVLGVEPTGQPGEAYDPRALGGIRNAHERRRAVVHEEIARHIDASDFRVHHLWIRDPAVLVIVRVAGSSVRGEVAVVAPRDVAVEGLEELRAQRASEDWVKQKRQK